MTDSRNFDQLWDFNDPKKTEGLFRELLPTAGQDHDYRLQLLTQIARTQGLQRKFSEAHETLDEVDAQLAHTLPLTHVRSLLERGRVFNSSQNCEKALPIFMKAYDLASANKLDFYAVDALHMLAIAEKDPAKQMEWNLKAISQAENAQELRARKWLGSLYNNTGWTLHDGGKFDEALKLFHKALDLRREQGDAANIRVAKWSVARALRSLSRLEEALTIQRALEKEHHSNGTNDGYVCEEIAELLREKGDSENARPYFAKAYELLSRDEWLKANETQRLERLQALSRA